MCNCPVLSLVTSPMTQIGLTFSRQSEQGRWRRKVRLCSEGQRSLGGQGGKESPTTINSWRNLPFFSLSLCADLRRSPLLKGRAWPSLQPEMQNPLNKPGPRGRPRNHPHRSPWLPSIQGWPAHKHTHVHTRRYTYVHTNGQAWALLWLYLRPVTKTYECSPESSLNHG